MWRAPGTTLGSLEMGIYCLEGPELSLTLRQEGGLHGFFVVKATVPQGQTVVTMRSTSFLGTSYLQVTPRPSTQGMLGKK